MKTLSEIDRELSNLHRELNDPDMVLDDDWRGFLEHKQRELWSERKQLERKPSRRFTQYIDADTDAMGNCYSDADPGL
jgi:hypothetical protein